MLDYAFLAALSAVVAEGSFERAAATLCVTPSAVSQRVRALEERVGAILVVRGNPCRATPTGLRLCAHVEQVRLLESDVATGLQRLAGHDPAGRPSVRIAVNTDSLITWFPAAAQVFTEETGALLDLVLDDEEHTAARLQTGEVLAAVTADPTPVAGCRAVTLGAIRYVAAASPAFMERCFAAGVDAGALATAPILRFDRRDRLQARWAMEAHGWEGAPPRHGAPSTQGMLDLTLRGLGWSMIPLALAEPYLAGGRLVELPPGHRIHVKLYWQVNRIGANLLARLTQAVQGAARQSAVPLGAALL